MIWNFKKKNPLENHQMAILLVLSKVSQDKILYHSKEEVAYTFYSVALKKKWWL